MAMLAEPRRKQRVGPNPRGKFFTEDEDNRGRNMLTKMGWSKGDGLGVERQGITEPIRPKIQNDAKGLGYEVNSDPWVAHSDDFNAVLKNLQASYSSGETITEEKEETSSSNEFTGLGFQSEEKTTSKMEHIDLEKNSRSSRSRIHYQKFIKNKDLSKIKQQDWSCIFGKAVDESTPPMKQLIVEPPVPVVPEAGEEEKVIYGSEKFINRGSIFDYFKAQRAKAFVKSATQEGTAPEINTDNVDNAEVKQQGVDQNEDDKSTENVKKEKKSKKKRRREAEDVEDDNSELKKNATEDDVVEVLDGEITSRKRKKSKKSDVLILIEEEDVIEEPLTKKDKKSKKRDKDLAEADQNETNVQEENTSVPIEVVDPAEIDEDEKSARKRRKKEKKAKKLLEQESNNNGEGESVEDKILCEEQISSKKTKKRKIKNKDEEETVIIVEEILEEPKKVKKSKKSKDNKEPQSEETSCDSNNANVNGEVDETEKSTERKKQKKDKKSKKSKNKEEQEDHNSSTLLEETPELDDKIIIASQQLPDDKNIGIEITEGKQGNFNKRIITAEEYYNTAMTFTGSNLIKIPGYRNQSNKIV